MTDLAVLLAVLAATAAAAWWWRRRQGSVRPGRQGERLSAEDRAALGAPAGGVLLLEFSAPGCVPCRAARGVLEAVAAHRPDVRVVVADVGRQLELARAHGVLRAPTTLVVDRDGVVRHRINGVPAPETVAAVLDPLRDDRAA